MITFRNILKSYLPLVTCFLLLNNSNLTAQVDYKENLTVVEHNVGFLLTWTTSSETNNQFFVIERSRNGEAFETLESVDSKYNRSATSYKYADLDLGLTKVSYRLKQVSKNGDYSYSSEVKNEKNFVCHFQVTKKEKLKNNVLQVSINSVKAGDLEYRLINNAGDILLEELKSLKEGLNDYVLDFQNEADGDYHLIFKLGTELESVYFNKVTKDKKANVAKKESEVSGG